MMPAPVLALLGALAIARAGIPSEALVPDPSAASPVPGMPDPLSAEWNPPPGPSTKPAPAPPTAAAQTTGLSSPPRPTTAAVVREPIAPEPLLEPQYDPRRAKRILFTGLGFAIAGAVSGSVAYYASTKVSKAQERLDEPELPGEMQVDRAALEAERGKQRTIVLASSVTAAVLGATGIVLLLVGALHKPSPRRRAITTVTFDGLRLTF